MDSYSLGSAEHGYTRRTQIELCSLRQDASIDRPSYRHATYYEIDLGPEDFQTLDGLKIALQDKTKAGFLKSQFFRVRIKYFDEDSSISTLSFLSSSEEVRSAYQIAQNSGINWSLFVVRYTKAQSAQLQAKIPPEEYEHLQRLLGSKRKYERHVKVLHDNHNCSMIKVSNKEGIIHGSEYIDVLKSSDISSISSTTSLQIQKSFSPDEFPVHSTVSSLGMSGSYNNIHQSSFRNHSYVARKPQELFSYVNSLVASTTGTDIPQPNLIPTDLFTKNARYIPSIIHRDDYEYRDDDIGCSPLEQYQIIERIKQDSPFSRLFSIKNLEIWANEIQTGDHTSYVFPPAYFPIPDVYETRGFKNIAVDNDIIDIAMLYSIYLSQKHPIPRGYNAEDYRIDDLLMYSDIDKNRDYDDDDDDDDDENDDHGPHPDPDDDEDEEEEDEEDGAKQPDDRSYDHANSTCVSPGSHPNAAMSTDLMEKVHSSKYELQNEHD